MQVLLVSNHRPLNLLCKSYTCEKLDEACINTLLSFKRELKYADLTTMQQPKLKSLVRKTKCVAHAAHKAMLELASHEESAKPTSMAKEIDIQIKKDGVAKSMSLYKERRLTKLGYCSASVLDFLQQYEEILNETRYNNMLVQACILYVESDYIPAAFKVLGYFTFKITILFLN